MKRKDLLKKFIALIDVSADKKGTEFSYAAIEAYAIDDAEKLLNIKYEGRVHSVEEAIENCK